MSVIANVRELSDLVKKVGDIELYRKIVDLQGEVVALAGRKAELELENRELKEKLAQRATMVFKEPYYWVEGDNVPFCPKCWESAGLQIHLAELVHLASGKARLCRHCKELIYETRENPYTNMPYAPRMRSSGRER